jgi:hypothetical protein
MLRKRLGEPSTCREHAGGLPHFGASTNSFEDEDDDEYENEYVQTPNAERQTPNAKRRPPNAERRPLPQPFDLLQHSFGDFADLARSQE